MENIFERQLRKMLEFVTGGTRGGPMRLRILEELAKRPRNTNEVSKILGIDYKTTEYHLRVLKENGLVVGAGEGYGSKFSLSPLLGKWGKAHKTRVANKK